jgi:hypothetical protein
MRGTRRQRAGVDRCTTAVVTGVIVQGQLRRAFLDQFSISAGNFSAEATFSELVDGQRAAAENDVAARGTAVVEGADLLCCAAQVECRPGRKTDRLVIGQDAVQAHFERASVNQYLATDVRCLIKHQGSSPGFLQTSCVDARILSCLTAIVNDQSACTSVDLAQRHGDTRFQGQMSTRCTDFILIAVVPENISSGCN